MKSNGGGGRYAKLAISLDSNSDRGPFGREADGSSVGSQVVEVSDKATETTPSLCQYYADEDESYGQTLLEDYYDPDLHDHLQCYDNDYSDSFDEEEGVYSAVSSVLTFPKHHRIPLYWKMQDA